MKLIKKVTASLAVLSCVATASLQADDTVYRPVDPENLLLMTVDSDGRRGVVAIELADWIAPNNVDQMKKLARAGFFDGLDFYRVIENFVVQGGDVDSKRTMPDGMGEINAELELAADKLPEEFASVEVEDMFASETGMIKGFAVARDDEKGPVWMTHCPGTLAMARGNDINSASTEFYFAIGQASRHLDRNMTVIGRVLEGFEHIAGAKRDELGGDGIIADPNDRTILLRAQVAADSKYAPKYEVEDTTSVEFYLRTEARRKRTGAFWHKTPPSLIDVCTVKPKIRKVTG